MNFEHTRTHFTKPDSQFIIQHSKIHKYYGKEEKSSSCIQSGGLDTSFTVMYLAKREGYEVYGLCQYRRFQPRTAEDKENVKRERHKLGAVKIYILDMQEYYEKSLKYAVFGNVLRNGTYPISVSSERIFQGRWPLHATPTKSAQTPLHMVRPVRVTTRFVFDMTFLSWLRAWKLSADTRHGFEPGRDRLSEQARLCSRLANWKYSYNVGLWGTLPFAAVRFWTPQGLP